MSADNFQNIPLKSETGKILMKFIETKQLDFKFDSEAISYFISRKMKEMFPEEDIESICEKIEVANNILEIDESAAIYEAVLEKNGSLKSYSAEIEKIFSNFAEQREASEGKNRK